VFAALEDATAIELENQNGLGALDSAESASPEEEEEQDLGLPASADRPEAGQETPLIKVNTELVFGIGAVSPYSDRLSNGDTVEFRVAICASSKKSKAVQIRRVRQAVVPDRYDRIASDADSSGSLLLPQLAEMAGETGIEATVEALKEDHGVLTSSKYKRLRFYYGAVEEEARLDVGDTVCEHPSWRYFGQVG
jgi:hypothetical protein